MADWLYDYESSVRTAEEASFLFLYRQLPEHDKSRFKRFMEAVNAENKRAYELWIATVRSGRSLSRMLDVFEGVTLH